jgi:putative addiction module component (TIGR02574 family)
MAASRLIDQALALSVTERLKLVADLLESVDGPPPADWEQAWSIEIDRRLNDPTDEVMSWDEVRSRLVNKLA